MNCKLSHWLLFACLLLWLPKVTLAEKYYIPPCLPDEHEIPDPDLKPGETAPPDDIVPSSFLPSIQNQGSTTSCGPHAAVIALEAFLNSIAQSNQATPIAPIGLSVLGTVLNHEVCTPTGKNFLSSENPVSFLLKVRSSLKVVPSSYHGETVAEAWQGNQCLICQFEKCRKGKCTIAGIPVILPNKIEHGECLEEVKNKMNPKLGTCMESGPITTELLNSPRPLADLFKWVKIDTPPFNIITYDEFDNRDDLLNEVIDNFRSNNRRQPLVLSTCYDDTDRTGIGCSQRHAISLVGISKLFCKNDVSNKVSKRIAGIFKNSWGKSNEYYNLEKMIEGMYRHKLGFAQIKLCNEGSEDENLKCLHPPIMYHKKANPLWYVAEAGDLNGVYYFLSLKGLDPNHTKDDGATPLFISAENGHADVVKALLADKRTEPNKAQASGATPLYIAVQNGHADVVKALLADKRTEPNKAQASGATPLYIAVQNGHADVIKILLADGRIDPNIAEAYGTTPLYIAAENGHVDAVKALLADKRTEPNKTTKGWTPLFIAVTKGHIDVIKILLADGRIDPNKTVNNETPLCLATWNNNLDIVKVLLAGQADPNMGNKITEATPLLIASQNGYINIVKTLLADKQTDPNKVRKVDKATPLIVAVAKGHVDIVKALLEDKRTDPNIAEANGATPLCIAEQNKYEDIIKVLLADKRTKRFEVGCILQ